ncbi:6-O-methylguanine DNA methyltransferase, DNA binding domain-containing protein [Hirsutella rhossiliensis]|uniref:Methylated-DNA--protein-cysteine methyltransferase n=1 Tax=Hirsutella rhossiliensis TaxID=111463 RepID=A0A9P8MUK6_9HYPO|nr:6-O-methylguanine DNA methyltransferase, DNA binding domain-containing protein [Hirsutella rhossiliensis]KAH0960719.1 6-O-methylguanine DNA methyltransferase, DNA binding domain-containing protein [Hirsutella rhossiliensis]
MAAGRKRMQESASPAPAPKVARTNAISYPATAKTARKPGEIVLDSDTTAQLARIAQSDRSAYEKRVWTALCHIPKGCVTTYGLLSAHLGSSPRAVGNALRRNPFAPDVPCHRVVASGMSLGGFKGKWPRDGEGITLDEKRRLLRSEGIRFDDKGKVLGTPWVGWM